eukprot:357798-Chlamydomonas_euryale.AAC.12
MVPWWEPAAASLKASAKATAPSDWEPTRSTAGAPTSWSPPTHRISHLTSHTVLKRRCCSQAGLPNLVCRRLQRFWWKHMAAGQAYIQQLRGHLEAPACQRPARLSQNLI